jgi:hypothetical protein
LQEPTEHAPVWVPLLLVAAATLGFGALNVHNAAALAPHWGQDLAFFHQLVHSAATGGPWASPLILEPQGFLGMVHTHLVLPLVVGLYRLLPHQETLLWAHSAFAALALWPALRLGETVGGRQYGLIAAFAVAAFGPFQAVATADFRPVVLFVPGILGVLAEARRGRLLPALGWAAVAMAGRQEAAYLLSAVGFTLLWVPWGGNRRRLGATLLLAGLISWAVWTGLKPQMFFHFNPSNGLEFPDQPELWAARGSFALRLLASGWSLAFLAPAGLIAGLPVILGLLSSGHEWHRLVGPGAHHHAFWLPFVLASGIVAVRRIPGGKGPLMLVVLGAISFPWASPRTGPTHLTELAAQVPPDAAVAADYDTIHLLAGRAVLWNVDQLLMSDRPVHWQEEWPIPVSDLDWILMPATHPLSQHTEAWTVIDTRGRHVLLQRREPSGQTTRPSP